MLSSLLIKNYAIIRELNVGFSNGFCVVTGETGAGKSIIMGALSLILGQRADTSVLNNQDEKCVVEGRFKINENADIKTFFDIYDLDYESTIILRREISPAGKSRAFINDTPVQLNIMRELGIKLIDVHSQHSNLELGKHQFQLNVIDWYGGHEDLLSKYSVVYKELKKLEGKLADIKSKAQQSKTDLDFYVFQYKQLEEVKLVVGEQEELEQEQEVLTHSEEIKSGLSQIFDLLDREEQSVILQLKEAMSIMLRLSTYLPSAISLHERMQSQFFELRDIAGECEILAGKTESDPKRLEFVSARLDSIYTLQQKHRVSSIEELIAIKDDFDAKIQLAASYEDEIEELEKAVASEKAKVIIAADALSVSRKSVVPAIEKEIISYLNSLGMPNGVFNVEITSKEDFSSFGIDDVSFLFNANRGGQPEEIYKIASGGELSRLMLAIKSVVAKSKALPAIIFDEIDTGISGEIAIKMGDILNSMSQYMQVINITHLPQIASKGKNHYLVFKNDTDEGVETGMRQLDISERITEIAKMLSGDIPTQEAIANSKSLLGI